MARRTSARVLLGVVSELLDLREGFVIQSVRAAQPLGESLKPLGPILVAEGQPFSYRRWTAGGRALHRCERSLPGDRESKPADTGSAAK
jgi:hypothetical protein